MPDDGNRAQEAVPAKANKGFWGHCESFLNGINKRFHFFISLPVITALGSLLASHFQYVAAYQDKVNSEAKLQVAAAETSFADISTKFSKAITLQQYLYFDFRDVINTKTQGDDRSIEAKNARAVYPQYEELRIALRENVDLLARKVELDLDWPSDTGRDSAKVKTIGLDPMSRIKLGAYDFECEQDIGMPNFNPGESQINLAPPKWMRDKNPKAPPLGIDWYSTKHQLLTLYYCFEVAHRRIAAARKWAANSSTDPADHEKFEHNIPVIQDSFDREAVRLNAFMTLAARRIEMIRAKFRPTGWYCHVPVVREVVDGYSKSCTPIRSAEN